MTFFSNAFQSQKQKKQRISLTPGFYGGRKSSESQDADHEKITSILGVKDYSPFEKTERRARRNKENVSHNLVFFILTTMFRKKSNQLKNYLLESCR